MDGSGFLDLSAPSLLGGHAYATNGRIAARVPASLLAWAAERGEGGPVGLDSRFASWGAALSSTGVAPPPCGFGAIDCPRCAGSGARCVATACMPCGACDGSGEIPSNRPVEILPGFRLAERYVALIARFDGRLYLPSVPTPGAPAGFVCRGGQPGAFGEPEAWSGFIVEGFVMPIDPGARR